MTVIRPFRLEELNWINFRFSSCFILNHYCLQHLLWSSAHPALVRHSRTELWLVRIWRATPARLQMDFLPRWWRKGCRSCLHPTSLGSSPCCQHCWSRQNTFEMSPLTLMAWQSSWGKWGNKSWMVKQRKSHDWSWKRSPFQIWICEKKNQHMPTYSISATQQAFRFKQRRDRWLNAAEQHDHISKKQTSATRCLARQKKEKREGGGDHRHERVIGLLTRTATRGSRTLDRENWAPRERS